MRPLWHSLCLAAQISSAAAAPELRWLADHSAVEVAGIAPPADPEQWPALLSVRVDGADTAMLGTWDAGKETLRFTPRFPLTPGMRYRATFQPPAGEPSVSLHTIPKPDAVPATVVAHVFPGGDAVPENLLKFYLHFSGPMSGGGIYRHIHLRDESGRDVELPFLEIDEELWDRDMQRLTLFIDPGRIKREVKPLQDIGPALVAGRRFSLVIDAAWPDAAGLPLAQGAERKFTVTPPDRSPPDAKAWKVTAPAAGTREALRVTFAEPMEHALALRLVTVAGVAGRAALDAGGTEWRFTPERPWAAGGGRLVAQPELEDLAGNSLARPFETDLAGTGKEGPAAKPVEIPFAVK